MRESRFQYYAFISYSHKDQYWAEWLQKKLESYRIPSTIRKELGEHIPPYMRPVFRDKSDLGVGDLAKNLQTELEDSRYLILVCSPSSARSRWVNEEVEHFKRLGRAGRIIPFIVEGAPDATDVDAQCYPPALRDGGKEILGASLQEMTREAVFIRIVA